MQHAYIKQCNSCSKFLFIICKGVRQGRVLSPKLFMNQLSKKLIVSNADCYFNSMSINHVMYANDLCLLATTVSTMQYLLDVCQEYGTDNDILFNPIKFICTFFKLKAYELCLPTVFIGQGALKNISESKYLDFNFSDLNVMIARCCVK